MNDDELYERFVEESARQHNVEQRQETQQTQEELQEELQETLNGILQEIEHEVSQNQRRRRLSFNGVNSNGGFVANVSTHTSTSTTSNGNTNITNNSASDSSINNNNNTGVDVVANGNNDERRTPFNLQRRPILRVFLRNLLVLDYFVLLLLFPFSMYNILRSGFSSMTFSENDFIQDMLVYIRHIRIFSDDGASFMIYKEGSLGLLGKFHNIVVFYSSPLMKQMYHEIITTANGATSSGTGDNFVHILKWILLQSYKMWVKGTTVMIYFMYGFGGTVYLFAAGFFFLLCFTIATVRRYKGMHQMIGQSLDSSSSIPGLF
ncbi:hypothetical protein Kpol_1039p68 [Vanderwaltozyma polyspora DSM 70294]|uniref:Uncharacterized protein n=1 Tax=Vanderwaltozyma polyspora (strain ATCC 22028 / DSM 70294 / BCRC 21397 / CBS 2163 / NBRC 10782 / NRRL Y-8283 / UCD 57-17) TaxID=436907 RepID=A7THJ3_VANPO|nr:uncharacterized protein Kpol_1039p68 [Vanderwaltozyma polyspora DSM 70294]EDO18317.1 hypothetical protein Kpol_1039p68 [Vanderwaltozyma polyspora DSM 70294]